MIGGRGKSPKAATYGKRFWEESRYLHQFLLTFKTSGWVAYNFFERLLSDYKIWVSTYMHCFSIWRFGWVLDLNLKYNTYIIIPKIKIFLQSRVITSNQLYENERIWPWSYRWVTFRIVSFKWIPKSIFE